MNSAYQVRILFDKKRYKLSNRIQMAMNYLTKQPIWSNRKRYEMNKGSKYKSGQRPTFRIWDNENDEWYQPTYEAYRGKLEDILLSPSGDLNMRTLTGFAHESLFPERFEIVIDESQITDEQAWNKIAESYPETVHSLRITLDHAVFGQKAEPQKVKVPEFAAKWISKCRELNWTLPDLFAPEAFESNFARDTEEWLRQDKQNYDILARAWLDGYEVEEEPKWIVKDARTAGMYFKGIAGISVEGQFSNSWSQRDGCIKFSDKEKAEAVATLTGGTVEKV